MTPPTAPHNPRLRPFVRRIVLRAVARAYPKSRHGPWVTPPRSLLLIRPDHLGDVLFLTPALHALRLVLPETRITLLIGPWSVPVVQNNPDVDALLTCPFPGFERLPRANPMAPYGLLMRQARAVRTQDYDTAVVLRFDHWWGAWLAAAAGIPRRIGYDRPETHPFLTEMLPYRANRHEVEQNGTLLARLVKDIARPRATADVSLTRMPGAGRETSEDLEAPWHLGSPHFFCRAEDRSWAANWFHAHAVDPTRPVIGIHSGAGAAVKQWPAAAWAAVADKLVEAHGAQILLTGTASERSLTQAIAGAMTHVPIDVTGQSTFGQLAALQERCWLVVGSDSGPLHLAAALGVATVHLYGPVAPAKFGPWGDPARHIVLTTDWPCAPCNRLDWTPDVLPKHQCMGAITPERVLQAIFRLLQERNSP